MVGWLLQSNVFYYSPMVTNDYQMEFVQKDSVCVYMCAHIYGYICICTCLLVCVHVSACTWMCARACRFAITCYACVLILYVNVYVVHICQCSASILVLCACVVYAISKILESKSGSIAKTGALLCKAISKESILNLRQVSSIPFTIWHPQLQEAGLFHLVTIRNLPIFMLYCILHLLVLMI